MAKRKSNKKAKPVDLINFLRPKLRRISYQYPPRSEALKRSRVERGRYKCASCEKIYRSTEINLDHIQPVVDPHTGWTDWNDFISRMFCDADGYQTLCITCHDAKTLKEREIRKMVNKEKKKILKNEDDI